MLQGFELRSIFGTFCTKSLTGFYSLVIVYATVLHHLRTAFFYDGTLSLDVQHV